MIPRVLRLPNGHLTASTRISKVRVHPDRTVDPTRPYVEVLEGGRVVFAGPLPPMDYPHARTTGEAA